MDKEQGILMMSTSHRQRSRRYPPAPMHSGAAASAPLSLHAPCNTPPLLADACSSHCCSPCTMLCSTATLRRSPAAAPALCLLFHGNAAAPQPSLRTSLYFKSSRLQIVIIAARLSPHRPRCHPRTRFLHALLFLPNENIKTLLIQTQLRIRCPSPPPSLYNAPLTPPHSLLLL
jgi:hypothetical protein